MNRFLKFGTESKNSASQGISNVPDEAFETEIFKLSRLINLSFILTQKGGMTVKFGREPIDAFAE